MGLLTFGYILFVIIMLHELGHLLAAKFFGVRVKTYSIGFGWRIIGFKFWNKGCGKLHIAFRLFNFKPYNKVLWECKNVTEYRLSLVPFGGFCDIAGETKSTGKKYELSSKPFYQKTIIALAGVTVNIITGIIVLTGVMIKNFGFKSGIIETFNFIYNFVVGTFVAIAQIFTGNVELSNASDINVMMSNIGFEYVLIYFAVFSIIMSIVNLIPFPALDGSLPLLWILEKWTKNKANKLLHGIWLGGFVILMLLQVIVLYFWIFRGK